MIHPRSDTLRIGFTIIGGPQWTGGYHYLINLLRVLRCHAPGLSPLVFVGTDAAKAELDELRLVVGATPAAEHSHRAPFEHRRSIPADRYRSSFRGVYFLWLAFPGSLACVVPGLPAPSPARHVWFRRVLAP
jgi:hypothetical protein